LKHLVLYFLFFLGIRVTVPANNRKAAKTNPRIPSGTVKEIYAPIGAKVIDASTTGSASLRLRFFDFKLYAVIDM